MSEISENRWRIVGCPPILQLVGLFSHAQANSGGELAIGEGAWYNARRM
jgi:hypothetical protein